LPKPRVTINRTIKSIRRIFRWAASMELVPPSVPDALEKLELLRKGRTTAPELPKVEVVPDDIVRRTLPYLPEMVADMVRIQRLIGCRPGEICGMRPCDIDRSGPQWLWRPVTHKNDWRGHDRVSAIGPKAQAILKRYLDRDPNTPCFMPAESESARNAARRRGRTSPMTPSHRARRARASRKPKVIKPYSQASYRRAITRACEQAKIPAWSPNRLRHSAGEEARREMGLDAAQARLGHKDARVTEVYATVGIEKACQVAERLG
jgi:integrase